MRIQCNGCEAAEAKVLCCADEAALCWDCDRKVHSANMLAKKHQRLPLSHSSSQMPKCDICQETTGYFFCLEDRALFCRKCDVAIHTANTYVSGHQRFLLTGVKVGLGATEPCVSTTTNKSDSIENASETESSQPISKRNASIPTACEANGMLHGQIGRVETVSAPATSKMPSVTGDTTTVNNIPDWHLDDYLTPTDFSPNYVLMDNVSFSKWFSRR
ncbi:hypothetical protein CICLE_v10016655mg [Citrus x clementina]|uniref:B box-type domain-containing protein n=1 Tax=Citrus clementina TaxID=85681 RepID=V4TLB3_CITCL|nr:B-box zinc finger protein 22 isoform X2 [Citrus x clementina]ESR61248.1 hypothetical protein CICLE_v10016655mg [Citrus x clementina]